jgi:hypothetical protein
MEYKETWHGMHLILSLLTGGWWLLIWVWRALANADHNAWVDRHRRTEKR